MNLDIQKEVAEIQKMYNESLNTATFNALIYGDFGTGKTNLLRTCRLPVFVDSFDPGGTKTIRDAIAKGEIVADTRWENETPKTPKVAKAWDKAYQERKRSGFFNQFGTYAIDSTTTWSDAFAFEYLSQKGRAGGYLYREDYNPIMANIATAMRDILTLPCDIIFICHEDSDKDEGTGRMFIGPLFIGKSQRIKNPLLFDEIYAAVTKETSGGVNYQLLTRSTGLYKARTRLGAGGKFDMYEPQNIKALLKKAGYPTEDKPLFKPI